MYILFLFPISTTNILILTTKNQPNNKLVKTLNFTKKKKHNKINIQNYKKTLFKIPLAKKKLN